MKDLHSLLLEQSKTVVDDQLKSLLAHIERCTKNKNPVKIQIDLHIQTHDNRGEVLLPVPERRLDVRILPTSPADSNAMEWLDAEKFPLITNWAKEQPSFLKQIEYTIERLKETKALDEHVVQQIVDNYLKPYLKDHEAKKEHDRPRRGKG